MTGLASDLSGIVRAAFAELGLDEGFGHVQASDRPDLAQFQCNGALAAAKRAKANPREIATKVAERLRSDPIFAKVEVAGPGFINLDVSDAALTARAGGPASSPEPNGKSVVIDFGGANIAKPMHVGHLRSAIIGDALQRLFRANGWRVTSDVHLGDWGLQMGQLISEIAHRGIAPVYFDPAFRGPYPEESPVSMDDLEELYPAASAACRADPARLEEARRATAELQAGREGYRALWRHFFDVSVQGLKREYGSLGIGFDLWKGEASVDPLIPPLIESMKSTGLAVESEGALIVDVAEPGDKKEMPPVILVKSDGAVNYATTDLATIVDRVAAQDPDLILYVVDQRQHLHFEQVFRAARKARIDGRAALEQAGFGTLNGIDGKPFKTRAGGVMKLYDLIATMTAEAEKRLTEMKLANDYGTDERAEIARKVGIGALKFADLSNYRLTDYIFDLERFTRFEGKTGPYLQYAAVRSQSILRRATDEGFASAPPAVRSAEERALVLQLLALPEALASAESNRAPNVLCEYVFELAQKFSRFYSEYHILSEADGEVRASRIGLCETTLAALAKILDILGIEIPERM